MTQPETQALLSELARVKALFQARAIALHMGVDPDAVIYADHEADCPMRSPAPNAICNCGNPKAMKWDAGRQGFVQRQSGHFEPL